MNWQTYIYGTNSLVPLVCLHWETFINMCPVTKQVAETRQVCLWCSLVDDENHEDLISCSIKNYIRHTSWSEKLIWKIVKLLFCRRPCPGGPGLHRPLQPQGDHGNKTHFLGRADSKALSHHYQETLVLKMSISGEVKPDPINGVRIYSFKRRLCDVSFF